ncbi:MAG: YdeI/OmpD-associated family protein [Cyclobacteriaceae bacterium]
MKQEFTAVYEVFTDNSLWGGHIKVPLKYIKPFIDEGRNKKRVICCLSNTECIHAALMSDGAGGFFIMINKELKKKLDLSEGSKLTVSLEEDTSKYGIPMPEEMQELMGQDSEGDHYFHALTRGKQRSLLYLIGKPKTSGTRLKKALVIINYLKGTKGKLDFKELNQAMKNSSY